MVPPKINNMIKFIFNIREKNRFVYIEMYIYRNKFMKSDEKIIFLLIFL